MNQALILVEGQTEERVVKDVLNPALDGVLWLQPTILNTKLVKDGPNFKGGTTTYGKFRNDAARLLRGAGGRLVTTLIDYYGLPTDFPGMATRPMNARPIERVAHVQRAIAADLGSPPNFVPFVSLHETEAWLFVDPKEVARTTASPDDTELLRVAAGFRGPEDINETPEGAPSKRLLRAVPAFRKVQHGPPALARIGVDRIAAACPHFAGWMATLRARRVDPVV